MPPTIDRTDLTSDFSSPSGSVLANPHLVLAEEIQLQPAFWPIRHREGDHPKASFRPARLEGGRAAAILRVVELEGSAVVAEVAWSQEYASAHEAQARLQWLEAMPATCARLGLLAALFGKTSASSEIEITFEIDRRRLDTERIRLAEQAKEARLEAEQEAQAAAEAKKIRIWLAEPKGKFELWLKRGDKGPPLWKIAFSAKWERERFYDWFRWQHERFEALAEYLKTHQALDLERRLIAEMFETERAFKKSGVADRSRRPLRWWRGEQ